MDISVEESIEFAKSAQIPSIDDLDFVEDATAPEPPNFEKPELAVTVGSQIASFSENVSAELKEKVANGFLFAQQAANKQIEGKQDATSEDWYNTYVDVLTKIGWMREDGGAARREIEGTSVEVHSKIIPVITAALGPAVAASALIVDVLKGLNEMDQDTPWITLFSRESQRAEANQFQMSHVDSENGAPRITLVNFELSAERSVTQVLFFKFHSNEAKLTQFQERISVNEPIFSQVAPVIADRLADRVRQFVMEIEI